MKDRSIKEARFLDDYVIEAVSETGSMIRLNMKPFLHTTRFLSLRQPEVFKSGMTDGVSIIWPGVAEMSYDELSKRVFW